MARTTTPLSNTEIKQAKPREREYNLADGQGLGSVKNVSHFFLGGNPGSRLSH